MIELKKILYTTDFGESAEVALRYATMLAGEFGAELHMLHVICLFNEGEVRPEEVFKEMEKHAESYAEQLNQAAHKAIDRKIEDHKSHDLKMFKYIQRGFSPYEEIVR